MQKVQKRLIRGRNIARRIKKAQGSVPLWLTRWIEHNEGYVAKGKVPWQLFDTAEENCEFWRVDPKSGKEIPYVWETSSTILRKIGDHYIEQVIKRRVGFRKKIS